MIEGNDWSEAIRKSTGREASGGEVLAAELLPKYLKALQGKVFTETYTQIERKVWDNWPFFLLFATLLTTEWWIRKRHGWV